MEGIQPQRGSTQVAGLSIPANHSGYRDRWNLVPLSIGSFVSECSSFVLEGHQIQSAECLSFRGAERTAFILLSLWPYIKAVELEGSSMRKRAGRRITRKWLQVWWHRALFHIKNGRTGVPYFCWLSSKLFNFIYSLNSRTILWSLSNVHVITCRFLRTSLPSP